ncbi:MAG TPA: M23 family metallopeptidase [Ornithinimicrobium sp.]|nr:M23 family metallopeptidase [Ornithinimicrobium sp.]
MTGAVRLRYPFSGRWLVQNSPADRVPSHGTHLFGTTYAIDFVPVDGRGRSAPLGPGSLLRPESPQRLTGFGRPVLAPCPGIVVATHDGEVDHDAYRGLPSVGYALTQRRRARRGWVGLAGNHVVVEVRPGVLVALCHLRRGSIIVEPGRRLAAGQVVGRCGNSGNSTQPHLHLQALDRLDVGRAEGLPLSFPDGLPRNGRIVEAP